MPSSRRTDASIAFSVTDNLSQSIVSMKNSLSEFRNDAAGLQKQLDMLDKTKIQLKNVDLKQAKQELQQAEKAIRELGDAATEADRAAANANFERASQNYENIRAQLDLTSRQARQTQKDLLDATGAISKVENRAGSSVGGAGNSVGGAGSVLSALGKAGLFSMAGDAAGKRWLLPDEVAIPQSGEITVTATAEESGDIRAAAGDIVKILTPARGWQSVGNPAAALPGAAVETDAELRRRQAISTALPSLTVFEGTLGAVASIPGVTRSRGYENDGGVPDADGIPGHSICMVVEGGDTAAIAEAIAAKKGPGAGTYGTTEALVRDKFGVPNVIKFFRPVETPVYATVTIRPFPGYLSTTGESIRKNVAEHINGLNIGDDVSLSRLYSPANAANAASYDIESITLGTSQGAQSAANVAVAFNAVASCSVDRVKLVVRP